MSLIRLSAVAAVASLLSSAAFAYGYQCQASTFGDGNSWNYQVNISTDNWGRASSNTTVWQDGRVVLQNAPGNVTYANRDSTQFSVQGSVYGLFVNFDARNNSIQVTHNTSARGQVTAWGQCR